MSDANNDLDGAATTTGGDGDRRGPFDLSLTAGVGGRSGVGLSVTAGVGGGTAAGGDSKLTGGEGGRGVTQTKHLDV